mmetsp:Transcript_23736/g.29502  ORF Transcript_23736/g.29502 Transcript_23736/m.29502 type:complete len:108 (+) Transcript_23736:83-406(+)
MQFRLESKQLNYSEQKIKELSILQEKAIRRVNYSYTQHLICSSNLQQKKLDMLGDGVNSCKVYDQLATSTGGFVEHLNVKLNEMTSKGDMRQKQLGRPDKQDHFYSL